MSDDLKAQEAIVAENDELYEMANLYPRTTDDGVGRPARQRTARADQG
jgi:hypothetical protein